MQLRALRQMKLCKLGGSALEPPSSCLQPHHGSPLELARSGTSAFSKQAVNASNPAYSRRRGHVKGRAVGPRLAACTRLPEAASTGITWTIGVKSVRHEVSGDVAVLHILLTTIDILHLPAPNAVTV